MDARDYERMYAGVIALGVLGVSLYLQIGVAEYYVCRWKVLETRHA